MPKPTPKRARTAKTRSSKRTAGKAKPKPSAKRSKPARAAKSSAGGIDPRVLAAIGLALEDEANASARAEQLAQPVSPWVALGRVRAVRTN